MEHSSPKLQHYFFLVVFLVVLVIMFFILKPFLSALVLAFTLSIIFRPVYNWLSKKLNGWDSIAALLTVVVVILVVLIPLILIGSLLFDELRSLYLSLADQSGDAGIIAVGTARLQTLIRGIFPNMTIDVVQYIEGALTWLVSHLNLFFSQFLHAVLVIFVMIIALYYLLRDGSKLKKSYLVLSPLSDVYDENILNRVIAAVNSVVKGSLIIAVIQGVLAAIGTSIAGLPNPIIWGTLATIGSLIPGVGTGLVIGPAIIYLFFTGDLMHAIILLVWQVLVVGLIDNFLTPYLLNKGMKIHPFLILLSVIGGILFFGPIGFILGPILIAFLFALLDIYPLIMKSK